jgi:putative SOS response-associated peptidase YedK
MYNLYAMTRKDDDLARFFRVSQRRRARGHPDEVGFMRLEKGRAPKPVTNVRDNQIRTNPFWRDSFRQRCCLVPASSFCEPV